MRVNLLSYNRFCFLVLMIFSIHFYGLYHQLSPAIYDLIDACSYAFFFLFLIFNFGRKSTDLVDVKPLYKIYVISFLFWIISSLSSWYFHGQNPLLTLLSSRSFFYLLILYVLVKANYEVQTLLKIIKIFCLGYMAVFTLQLLLYPFEIVPLGNATEIDRGFLRVRVEGVGFVTLFGFYSLNSFMKDRRLSDAAFFILCLFFVFLLGFRTLLLTYLVSSVLLFLLYSSSLLKSLIYFLLFNLFLFFLYQIDYFNVFISDSILQTKDQIDELDEYIRFLTFDFWYREINVNLYSLLLGNGAPFESSSYGKKALIEGALNNGFIAQDLGLIGFSFYHGVFFTLSFVALFLKVFFLPLGKDFLYVKAFIFYLIISSFTTAEIFRAGMFGVVSIAFYLGLKSNKNLIGR